MHEIERVERHFVVADNPGCWILRDGCMQVQMCRKAMYTLKGLAMGSQDHVGTGNAGHRRGDKGAE